MKFNLGMHEQSVGMVDLETLAQECEISYEAAVQAGYECKEMEIILDNMRFAKNAIALNGVEWYINNCDNTNELGRVLGKSTEDLTVDAATEGIKKLAAEAWDKIKAFFARIWKWMRDAYDRLTGSVTEKKLAEVENNLKKLGSSDEVFKRVSFSGNRPIMTFKTVNDIYDKVKVLKKKYDAYSKLLEDHLKNVKKILQSKGTANLENLKGNVEVLRTKVDELRDLSNEIKGIKNKSGSDTSTPSDTSLFRLGYNSFKMIRLCSFIRDMQADAEKIKRNEDELEKLKTEISKLCDSVISAGSEGLGADSGDDDYYKMKRIDDLSSVAYVREKEERERLRDKLDGVTVGAVVACMPAAVFLSGPIIVATVSGIVATWAFLAFAINKKVKADADEWFEKKVYEVIDS